MLEIREISVGIETSCLLVKTDKDSCFCFNDPTTIIEIKSKGNFAIPLFHVQDDEKQNIIKKFESYPEKTTIFFTNTLFGILNGGNVISWETMT